eukprot:929220_1
MIMSEIKKVNDFYESMESELVDRFSRLRGAYPCQTYDPENCESSSSQWVLEHSCSLPVNVLPFDDEDVKFQKLSRSSFSYFYRKATKLINFQTINFIGFRKIIKKFDKRLSVHMQQSLMFQVRHSYFARSTRTEDLIRQIVCVYAKNFENGDDAKAKASLLAKMTVRGEQTRKGQLIWGMKLGMVSILCLWVMLNCVLDANVFEGKRAIYPVYRALGVILLIPWFWGANIYIWRRYRINYVFIFEFDPRTRMTTYEVLDTAASITIVFLINFLLFISHERWFGVGGVFSYQIWPCALFIFFILNFIPLPNRKYNSTRFCFFNVLMNIVLAPFGRIRFRDFFLADILTSLSKVLKDLAYCFCMYVSSVWIRTTSDDNVCSSNSYIVYYAPLLIALPYWLRFCQCLSQYHHHQQKMPYLANSVKYALAWTVTIVSATNPSFKFSTSDLSSLSAYHLLFYVLITVGTVYQFVWDIKMDWGLFSSAPDLMVRLSDVSPLPKPTTSPHLSSTSNSNPRFLRSKLMFPSSTPYYIAIFVDLILRFVWVYQVLAMNQYYREKEYYHLFSAVFVALEIFRRFLWSVFRVERENVSNFEKFREEAHVPVDFDYTNREDSRLQQIDRSRNWRIIIEITALVVSLTIAGTIALLINDS